MNRFKHLLSLGLLLAVPLVSTAQVVLKPVKVTVAGVTTDQAIIRDLTLFPRTDQGDAAFASSISSLSTVARPAAGAVIGQFNYIFSDARRDFSNKAFTAYAAPNLAGIGVTRPAPRPSGNFFSYTPQQAANVALLRRLPAFNVHSSKLVVYAGVNFNDATDRAAIATRGFNAVAENVPNPMTVTGKSVYLLGSLFDHAQNVAAGMSDSDPRKGWLLDWAGGNHYLIDDRDAGRALGAYMFQQYQQPYWSNNSSSAYGFCPDMEVHNRSPRNGNSVESQWQNMDAYIMEGARDEAIRQGKTPPLLIPYDWASLTPFHLTRFEGDQPASGPYYDNGGNAVNLPDLEPGVPAYFNYGLLNPGLSGGSKFAPIAANTPFGQYLKNTGGAIGSAEYFHYTGDDQTYFQKDGNGNYITRQVGGKTLFTWRTDSRRTTILGQTTDILGAKQFYQGEYYDLVFEQYERIASAFADQYIRAGGKHLPLSTDRQAGWENLKLMQWWRFDTEFKDLDRLPATNPATGQPYDIQALNYRPLYPQALEGDVMAQYFLRDVLRTWMGPQKQIDQGADYDGFEPGKKEQSRAKGTYEIFSKALYRARELDWLNDVSYRVICPRFWIKNQNVRPDPNEAFEKKPIIFGGIVPSHEGKPSSGCTGGIPCRRLTKPPK